MDVKLSQYLYLYCIYSEFISIRNESVRIRPESHSNTKSKWKSKRRRKKSRDMSCTLHSHVSCTTQTEWTAECQRNTTLRRRKNTVTARIERQQIEVICEQNVQKVPLVRGMCLIKSLVKVENKCQQIEKKCGKWMRWHWSEKYISIYSCNTHTHTLHLLTTQFPCELLLLLLFGVVAYRHL